VAVHSSLIKRLGKGVLGLTGLRLIDWVEVFYLPEEEIFVPIISKSGCSTIKEALIKNFNPSFESEFPNIHKVDPSVETDGKVVRLLFYRYTTYAKFASGKEMHLVLRDPAERFISCYKDMVSGNNEMYEHPSNLSQWLPFKRNLSFEEFSKRVYRTPDYLSDRHFRSQTFYLNDKITDKLSSLKLFSLSGFIKTSTIISSDYKKSKRKLNESKPVKVVHPEPEELNSAPPFRKRYARDIYFYGQLQTGS